MLLPIWPNIQPLKNNGGLGPGAPGARGVPLPKRPKHFTESFERRRQQPGGAEAPWPPEKPWLPVDITLKPKKIIDHEFIVDEFTWCKSHQMYL